MRNCAETGCNRPADAAGGTLCAVHGTHEMFAPVQVEARLEQPTPKPAGRAQYGPGTKQDPLYTATAEVLVAVAKRIGEVWIMRGDNSTSWPAAEVLVERGLFSAIPRRKGQKREVVVFMLTPRGKVAYP